MEKIDNLLEQLIIQNEFCAAIQIENAEGVPKEIITKLW